jgi:hypothetical protein
MSALSYFSPRFPPMRVVWEASAPTWMVFTGTSSISDGWTLGALAGALAREDEGSDPSAPAAGAIPAASVWSFCGSTNLNYTGSNTQVLSLKGSNVLQTV